jgi:signal-transduction protein with cAMP-binding, CBS, and nucleotidyltransferase domain
MPDSYTQEVRDLHLFSDMDEQHFQSLIRAAYVQNFPPQIELISEGDSSDFLHILLSGSVDLFSSWNNLHLYSCGNRARGALSDVGAHHGEKPHHADPQPERAGGV